MKKTWPQYIELQLKNSRLNFHLHATEIEKWLQQFLKCPHHHLVTQSINLVEDQFLPLSRNASWPVYKMTKYHHVELEITQIYLCFLAI